MRASQTLRSLAVLVTLMATVAGCSSDSKKVATTTTAAPTASSTAAPAATGTPATTGTSASTGGAPAAGAAVGPGTALDNCGQDVASLLPSVFLSSVVYAGGDTYLQCVVAGAVSADQIKEIVDKKITSLSPIAPGTAADSFVVTAPDGTKLTIAETKNANGKFYISSLTFG